MATQIIHLVTYLYTDDVPTVRAFSAHATAMQALRLRVHNAVETEDISPQAALEHLLSIERNGDTALFLKFDDGSTIGYRSIPVEA